MPDAAETCACFDCELIRAYLAVKEKHKPSACRAVATLAYMAGMTIGHWPDAQRRLMRDIVARSLDQGVAETAAQHPAGRA